MTDIKDLSMDVVASPSSVAEMPEHGPTLLSTIQTIFQRILQCPPVRPDDDFFDLGGDSILVIALVAEIETATGHALPITAIFDAPTPAGLARLVEDAAPTRQSSLVLLKPGQGGTPVFILHGVGGAVMELLDLGRSIDTDGPVYAVQARGLDGLEPPLDRIEDMATVYLSEIRTVQPTGPYALMGFSFGGLTALEIARNLILEGEHVALLALLDSYPHPKLWPFLSRLGILFRLASAGHLLDVVTGVADRYIVAMKAMPRGQRFPYILDRFKNAFRLHRIVDTFDHFTEGRPEATRHRQPHVIETPLPAAIRKVRESGTVALFNYAPTRFDGPVALIQAKDDNRFPRNPTSVWGSVMPALTVYPLNCSHGHLLSTHARQVGELVKSMLRPQPTKAGAA